MLYVNESQEYQKSEKSAISADLLNVMKPIFLSLGAGGVHRTNSIHAILDNPLYRYCTRPALLGGFESVYHRIFPMAQMYHNRHAISSPGEWFHILNNYPYSSNSVIPSPLLPPLLESGRLCMNKQYTLHLA